MKILVLSSHTYSLFWFRIDMMREFRSMGHIVVAVGQEPEKDWRDKFLEHNIQYRQIPVERNGLNLFSDLKTLEALTMLIDREKPDKIFAYQAKTIIYGSIAAKRCGVSETFILVAGLGSVIRGHGIKNSMLSFILKLQYKAACKNNRAVLFQNNDDRNFFLENRLVPSEKAFIINGSGVDVQYFRPGDLPETPSFLFVGRLIRDKGVMEYLEACRKIKQKNPQVSCVLVGPFDSNPSALREFELQPYIDDGTITYPGEQSDVRVYYEKCTTYVLPSYHEGTPKTVLEAMASGRSIITTDAPGCRETVVDGENGFLVPVKDISVIVEKMQYLIDNPSIASEMGYKSRVIAEEKYDVTKVNRTILDIMHL